jgi:hypothetical protein
MCFASFRSMQEHERRDDQLQVVGVLRTLKPGLSAMDAVELLRLQVQEGEHLEAVTLAREVAPELVMVQVLLAKGSTLALLDAVIQQR